MRPADGPTRYYGATIHAEREGTRWHMEDIDYAWAVDAFEGASAPLQVTMAVVAVLILIVALVALVLSIYLSISYVKYNRKANAAGLNGEQAARKILDANGLQNIKVKTSGSLMFGNSYSHYFKKVRLRRRTVKKDSVASLAMGSQKAALAVLDKEGDPDMRKRVRMVPIIAFGPFAFIPLVIVGAVVDVVVFNSEGYVTIAAACFGLLFYLISLFMSVLTLKTEKKAQERTYAILREEGMATEDELADMRKLFKLYNIQYITDIIMSLLEVIYYVLQIIAAASNKGGSLPASK